MAIGFLKWSVTSYNEDPATCNNAVGINYRYVTWWSARKRLKDSLEQGHHVVVHRVYPEEEERRLKKMETHVNAPNNSRVSRTTRPTTPHPVEEYSVDAIVNEFSYNRRF